MPKRRRPRYSGSATDESTSPPSSPLPFRIRRSASDGALRARSISENPQDVGTLSRPTRRQPVENLGPPRSDSQVGSLDRERERRNLEYVHHLNEHIFRLSRASPSPQELQRLGASQFRLNPLQNIALQELRRARLRQLRGHRGQLGHRSRNIAANILTFENDARTMADI